MSTFLGNCGCCPGDGGGGEPPPGDIIDDHWSFGPYYATKYAAIWIEGGTDASQPSDAGNRYGYAELFKSADGESGLISIRYFPLFDFASTVNEGTNRQDFIQVTTPGFGGYAGATWNYSEQIPASNLDLIDDKLDAGQFRQGQWTLCVQDNPTGLISGPYNDGVRSGSRHYYSNIPAQESWSAANAFGISQPVAAYDLTTLARGNVTDKRAANTGAGIFRRKQKTQVGYKKTVPADPNSLTVFAREFAIPTGFTAIPCNTQRTGSFGLPYIAGASSGTNLRIPANATISSSYSTTYNDGEYETYEAGEGEVIFFSSLSAADIITPPSALIYRYRVLNTPQIRVAIWHEEPYLKHEIYRDGILVATIDREPFIFSEKNAATGIGWGGYSLSAGLSTNTSLRLTVEGGGYFWEYVDSSVAPATGYGYKVKSYYDASRKSAESATHGINVT